MDEFADLVIFKLNLNMSQIQIKSNSFIYKNIIFREWKNYYIKIKNIGNCLISLQKKCNIKNSLNLINKWRTRCHKTKLYRLNLSKMLCKQKRNILKCCLHEIKINSIRNKKQKCIISKYLCLRHRYNIQTGFTKFRILAFTQKSKEICRTKLGITKLCKLKVDLRPYFFKLLYTPKFIETQKKVLKRVVIRQQKSIFAYSLKRWRECTDKIFINQTIVDFGPTKISKIQCNQDLQNLLMITSEGAGYTDKGSMDIVNDAETYMSSIALRLYRNLVLISNNNEDAIIKRKTFETMIQWTKWRISYKHSINWCNSILHCNESTAILFKFIQRWKCFIRNQKETMERYSLKSIQDQCIETKQQLKMHSDCLKEANKYINLILSKNTILNKKIVVIKKLVLSQLGQRISERLRGAFSTWKMKTHNYLVREQLTLLNALNQKQISLPNQVLIVSNDVKILTHENEILKENLKKNSELDHQVATIVREIKIMKLKLTEKQYDYELLLVENERLKEETLLQHQYHSKIFSK